MASPYTLLKQRPRPMLTMADLGLAEPLAPNPMPDMEAAAAATPMAPTQEEENIFMMPAPVRAGSGLSDQRMRQTFSSTEDKTSTESKTGQKDQTKQVENRNIYDPEQTAMNLQALMSMPEVQGQAEDEAALRNLYAQLAERKDALNLQPLYNVANYVTGGRSGEYSAPPTVSDREKLLLGQAGELLKSRRANFDKLLDNTAAMKVGTSSDLQSTLLDQTLMQQQLNALRQTDLIRRNMQAKDPMMGAGGARPEAMTRLVEKHQKRMEPIQGMLTSYNYLDKLVGGFENAKVRDIPGVGSERYLPMGLQSERGSEIKQAYEDLKNQLLYARSGKAINESEYQRLSLALGSSYFSTDREFIEAMNRFGNEMKDVMRQKEAAIRSVNPEVLKLYKQGGGSLSDDFTPPLARRAKTSPAGPKAPAKKDRSKMTDAELEAELSKRGIK